MISLVISESQVFIHIASGMLVVGTNVVDGKVVGATVIPSFN